MDRRGVPGLRLAAQVAWWILAGSLITLIGFLCIVAVAVVG
ncbi:MAG TPA: hypothetical protein VFI34_01390 [Candidatus Limnocylindrales bacterium]|nr:hypothetical protein [Candidatus Limnocylindrales bacterium]